MTCVDSINPTGDSRVSHNYASLNDKNYRESTLPSSIGSEQLTGNADYLLGVPTGGKYKATIFLVCADLSTMVWLQLRQVDRLVKLHGWPDLSMGWRYQIPMLLELDFRVVCPDLMGFGGTVSALSTQLRSWKFIRRIRTLHRFPQSRQLSTVIKERPMIWQSWLDSSGLRRSLLGAMTGKRMIRSYV